jgi:UDP-N-acetylglucosamine 2-epimerase (non-hydrolysing)
MNILYFFIGTEAELMKMFRVISLASQQGFICKIISNGQNIINNSYFLPLSGAKIDIDLSENASASKSSLGYLQWFLKTQKKGIQVMKRELELQKNNNCLMVVHGDTLSTLMGARIAKKVKMKYVHVESGLRSYHWFSPFPEEIDRFFSSLHSEINFCPQDNYAEYAAKRFKGKAVSTSYNTGIETLMFAVEENKKNSLARPVEEPYFFMAIHRQENLMSKSFMKSTIEHILTLSKNIKCVFVYHIQTYNALCKFGLWDDICNASNIEVVQRLPYSEFINYIYNSEFVIADGCGNQQEFYYLGKPYLIMRTKVEKDSEGLGWNAKCFENKFDEIDKFYYEYKDFIRPMIVPDIVPSEIIVGELIEYFKENDLKREGI